MSNRDFTFDSGSDKESFLIDAPPPSVSGTLHIGHIFSYAHFDFIARFQRLIGKNVLCPIGFDDNGLPTEKLVEKVHGKKARDFKDLAEYRAVCEKTIQNSISDFFALFRSIGFSFDYELAYRTMDGASIRLANLSFIDLFAKGLISSDLRPTPWDTVDMTAVSQADIIDKEEDAEMIDVAFKTEDGREFTVGTTRPELLFACVCVFAHPEDERFATLEGKNLLVPIYEFEVPALFDVRVDMTKGTGLVMCCLFGGEQDVVWCQDYLSNESVLADGRTVGDAFKAVYGHDSIDDKGLIASQGSKIWERAKSSELPEISGLKVNKARDIIKSHLEKHDLIKGRQKYTRTVKCAERSKAKIEFIMKSQTYVKLMLDRESFEESGAKIEWHPKPMLSKLTSWTHSLKYDWCVSRQREWGIRIPLAYALFENCAPVQVFWDYHGVHEKASSGYFCNHSARKIQDDVYELTQDYSMQGNSWESGQRFTVKFMRDVLDTWFTSSLTPAIAWSRATGKDTLACPIFDLRPQAHEIIRTWAFYTIVKSYFHAKQIPWKNIMVSGWCLASDKTKMSKSKGNIIEPGDIIDKFGPDPVRYWAASAALGSDSCFDEDIIKKGRRLTLKLENSARFVMSFSAPTKDVGPDSITCLMDRWVVDLLRSTLVTFRKALQNFQYAQGLVLLERFFFQDFCDNYIEICKTRAYMENPSVAERDAFSARLTSQLVLKSLLPLFSIFAPFTVQKICADFAIDPDISKQWPEMTWIDKILESQNTYNAHETGKIFIRILDEVRRQKAEKKVSVKTPIALAIGLTENECEIFRPHIQDLGYVCAAETGDISLHVAQDFSAKIEIKQVPV